jgi:2-amino-4-hydroxy-6-hydroxymethyldihydropteridine diphosphokinase
LISSSSLAYVCVGSNHAPSENIASGISLLRGGFSQVRASQIYKSKDIVGLEEDYWNLVVQFNCPFARKELKTQLQAIELACGRNKDDQLRGRVHLDLDILFIREDNSLDGFNWIVKQQLELGENSYVLSPLKELVPELEFAWRSANE